MPSAYLTTSWDDGHPTDMRVAELLSRYGLTGTFYVPQKFDRSTLDMSQLRELATNFEIGAHTVDHVCLPSLAPAEARRQIVQSKAWIQQSCGCECEMFCPPLGRFSRDHLAMIREAGFAGVRTVELLSVDLPKSRQGLRIMPTTIQAYPHGAIGYVRNTLRRGKLGNFGAYIRYVGNGNWAAFAERLLQRVLQRGGVFHLWGHSWEIDDTAQWHRLERVFSAMAAVRSQAPCLTNAGVCHRDEICNLGSHLH